jgi:2-aminophenol/2-amino-5-chlorophenol 1,6-dioxygenase alpha subunit
MREVPPFGIFEKPFKGALIPGLPHLLLDDPNYLNLKNAIINLGKFWTESGIRKLFFLSTQWRSVLGHSFLRGPSGKGQHVDENWYDFGPIDYELQFDPVMVDECARAAQIRGHQIKSIDYPGFPIDTGTLVAHELLSRGARRVDPHFRFVIGCVSCSIYSDYLDTFELARSLSAVLRDQNEPCAAVVVSQISNRTLNKDYGEITEQFASTSDELFNETCLKAIKQANVEYLKITLEEKGKEACADMSLMGIAFLEGLGLWGLDLYGNPLVGTVHAYGPIHGTGSAVISFETQNSP